MKLFTKITFFIIIICFLNFCCTVDVIFNNKIAFLFLVKHKLYNQNIESSITKEEDIFIVYYNEQQNIQLSKIAHENIGVGTYYYYIDLAGWKYIGMFISLYDNVNAKIYVSGQFDKQPKDCDYVDLTSFLMEVDYLESNKNHLLNLDTPFSFRWIKIEVIIFNISNQFGIWLQKSI